jgi:predicted transcriptional regulator
MHIYYTAKLNTHKEVVIMRKRTRGILEELQSVGGKDRHDEFLQTTGTNLIESSCNLIKKLHESYDAETALDLERRFLNAIRNNNPRKFKVGIDKVIEGKK